MSVSPAPYSRIQELRCYLACTDFEIAGLIAGKVQAGFAPNHSALPRALLGPPWVKTGSAGEAFQGGKNLGSGGLEFSGHFAVIWTHLRFGEELDSVKIKSAVTNGSGDARPAARLRRAELYFDLRTDWQVGDGKQAHASSTNVHADGFDVCGSCEHID